jgi:hypothetical protein
MTLYGGRTPITKDGEELRCTGEKASGDVVATFAALVIARVGL